MQKRVRRRLCEKYSVKKHLDRRRILCQLRLTHYVTHTHTHRHFDGSFAFTLRKYVDVVSFVQFYLTLN